MPNYQGSPNNLRKEPPKWKHLPTKAIRVPEVFADRLLDTARQLDIADTECTLEQTDSPPDLELGDTECTPEQSDSRPEFGLGNIERTLKAIRILTQALKLKPQNGGAIKTEIRRAINLLNKA